MKVYQKLVRDRIPEICTKNGQKANTSVLDEVSYQQALRKKLVEEVNEYLETGEICRKFFSNCAFHQRSKSRKKREI